MVASEKQIKRKNLEAELSVIKSEVDEKSVELSSILNKVDAEKANLAKFEVDKAVFNKEKEAFYKDKEVKVAEFSSTEKKHLATVGELTSKLTLLKEEVRDSTKQLARLNFSCLTAKSDLDKLQENIKEGDKKLAKLAVLVEHYEEMQEKVRLLNIERLRIINLITEVSNKSGIELKEAREELTRIRNEAQVVSTQRDLAAYELKSYTDQLYTAMNDYHIVKMRLEGVWGKTFPELDVPLSM